MSRRFRFSLERLLGLRRIEERLRKLEFASAQALLLQAEEARRRAEGEHAEMEEDLGRLRNASPLPLRDCLQAEACLDGQKHRIAQRTADVEVRRREAERAKGEFLAASTRRRALEKVRENRKAEHEKAMASAERKIFDEIASGRALARAAEAEQEDAT